jgi:hypothetical protein
MVLRLTRQIPPEGSVVTPTTLHRRHHPCTAFDYCVRGALGLHLVADVFAAYLAITLSWVWQYVALRTLEAPLVVLMLLIYMKARR